MSYSKSKKLKQGKYVPNHPEKYRGDVNNIIHRSGWEKTVMEYLDDNKNVLEWASEELYIWYKSPVDGKWHRYFPDFIMTAINKKGDVETFILEVKPYKQTIEPETRKKRKTKALVEEVVTWGINSSKWEAAKQYCEKRGWKFRLITEKELGKWQKKK